MSVLDTPPTPAAPGAAEPKTRFLPDDELRALAAEHGTPFYVYSAGVVRRRFRDLGGFDVVRYAQKANPNLSLLRFIRGLGAAVDAVSGGEVHRALAAGFRDDEIHFTADVFDRRILELLESHDLPVNLGSADMIEQFAAVRPGGAVALRINPGFGHGHDWKVNTGGAHSKHGIWYEELPAALERTARAGLTVTGVHVHIGSGSDFLHLSQVRRALADAALAASATVESISTGGGLPIPYHAGEPPFDVATYTRDWRETKRELEEAIGRELTIEVEPGRYLVAEAGLLVTEVRAVKQSGAVRYVLVDAGFDNLVRPAMYGAYHHISIVGRDEEPTRPRVVAGPLCESADMFTQGKEGRVEPRELPAAEVGDLLCVHDAGAYAASMASNYNSRLLAPELLVEAGVARLVRRRQTVEELLAPELELL
ncbi:MAG TPA: diaminopimelate decarboxylase [Thermoanaerobaculia bacterium]|jgi:diaminopimelate decarboxylase